MGRRMEGSAEVAVGSDVVRIVGTGAMGAALRARLAALHIESPVLDHDGPQLAGALAGALCVLLLRYPSQVRAVAMAAAESGPSGSCILVDLTTQPSEEAEQTARMCETTGIRYFAGGCLGGASDARSGCLRMLLGPRDDAVALKLQVFGSVVAFDDVRQACAAKLLHNFVLISLNHALGAALQLAAQSGVNLLEEILVHGPAGRVLKQQSVVRDAREYARSSYTAMLVAKDVAAIAATFPELGRLPGLDIVGLGQHYSIAGGVPYTLAALDSLMRMSAHE